MGTRLTNAMLSDQLKDSQDRVSILRVKVEECTAERRSAERVLESKIRGLEADLGRAECKVQTAGLAMRTIQQVLTSQLKIRHGVEMTPLTVLGDDGVTWVDAKEEYIGCSESIRLLRHINTLTEVGL